MKFCWLTDIHLNFLEKNQRLNFYQSIIENKEIDAILISGDIAEYDSLENILREMADNIKKDIYFILGNHDYYTFDKYNKINSIRKNIKKLCWKYKSESYCGLRMYLLNYISESEDKYYKLNENTILIGQDGWADGRYGDYKNSNVVLNDSKLIKDFVNKKGKNLLKAMQKFADKDALNLENKLGILLKENHLKKIIILMHVPPFDKACFYKDKISDDNWLPFFSSKIIGEILLDVAQLKPKIEFLVLCGHTHSKGIYKPLKNLIVKIGEAHYEKPQIQEIIEI